MLRSVVKTAFRERCHSPLRQNIVHNRPTGLPASANFLHFLQSAHVAER